MKKSRKNLLLYGLVMLLVLALTGAGWAAPADTKSGEPKSTETQPASVFKDVEAGDSNLVYINYLAKRAIISGFPDGGFHPSEGLSRAQAATLLAKAAGLSSNEKKTLFKDVYAGHWAAPYITAAAEAGYLKGYPDGTYHPEEKLTRAQGISLVLRLSKQKDTGVELPALKDLDSKHWAARSAAIGLAAGMVGLTSDKTRFLPDADFSRGDLSRALAVLLTTDPDLSKTSLNGSLEIKKGEVKVNDKKATDTITVKAGDLITTSAGAEAQLSYPDGSGLLIKENSKLTVKETRGRAYIKKDGSPGSAVDWLLVDVKVGNIFGALATNPNGKEENSEKKTAGLGEKLLAGISSALEYLAAGNQEPPWYKTAEVKKVKVKVDMPYGVAAIRGSFWNNMVNANGSGSTSLLEGSGEVTSGGQTLPLSPGQSTNMNQSGAPPSPPAPMTPQQVVSWTQQGSWLQTVAQAMQNNQEAPRTEPGITQIISTPVPGQPNPQPPVAPPPPTPTLPDIMNIVNQALTQVQQNAGFTNVVNFNNLPPNLESYLPPGYNPAGGGTTSTTANTADTESTSAAATLWSESFEGDISSWELNPDGAGLWNVVSNDSGIKNGAAGTYVQLPEGDTSEGSLPSTSFGSWCLWYGETNSTNQYAVGNFLKEQIANDQPMGGGHSTAAHSDYAISPAITIPDITGREFILSFNSWWEIEAVAPCSFDMMNVYIVDGEESILLDTLNPRYSYLQNATPQNNAPLAFTSSGYNTPGVWKTYQYNVSEYLGKSIKLKFEFNTGDTNFNAFRGWFIDQIKVTRLVSAPGNITGKTMSYTAGSGEAAGQNVSVQLLNKDNEVVAATLSGTDGSYSFSGIAPGNYSVKVESPFGYENYCQLLKVTVMPGQTATGIDFYLQALIPSIYYISANPYCEFSGEDQPIAITISTIAIAEGSIITVQLLNEDEQAVVGVSSASATVGSNNTAITDLTIPANTPCGNYYIKASINGVNPVVQPFMIISGWTAIGDSLTAAENSGLGLVVGTTNANLAYTDGSGHAMVYTNTLEGSTNWTLLGDALNTNGALVDLSIWNGAALAAYLNAEGVPTVASYVYDIGPWTTLTGGTVPDGTADSLSLDVGGVEQLPYLAYKNSGSVYAYVYGPCAWQPIASISSDVNTSGAVSINAACATPFLAYLNSDGIPMVQQYADSQWSSISNDICASASSLVLTVDGCIPYIAFRDETDNSYRGKVMKYMYDPMTGLNWTDLGYFSDGSANCISIAIGGNNIPYAAYSDGTRSGKLTVKYYDYINSQWVALGTEGISADAVTETRIRVFDGCVCVIYKNSSGNVSVMKHSLPTLLP